MKQPHACLLGRAPLLALVARVARHDDVLPVGLTTLGLRNNVLVLELMQPHANATVLTLALVPCVQVVSRELDGLEVRLERLPQRYDTRHEDFAPRVNDAVFVRRKDVDTRLIWELGAFARSPLDHGVLPRPSGVRSVTSVEN